MSHPYHDPARDATKTRYTRELESIFQRREQAAILRDLIERHQVTVPVLWELRAIRLVAAGRAEV